MRKIFFFFQRLKLDTREQFEMIERAHLAGQLALTGRLSLVNSDI